MRSDSKKLGTDYPRRCQPPEIPLFRYAADEDDQQYFMQICNHPNCSPNSNPVKLRSEPSTLSGECPD